MPDQIAHLTEQERRQESKDLLEDAYKGKTEHVVDELSKLSRADRLDIIKKMEKVDEVIHRDPDAAIKDHLPHLRITDLESAKGNGYQLNVETYFTKKEVEQMKKPEH